jgi:hydroxymethylpyrimidine pyrophosphatase-like HAD family hydrolase
MKEKEVHAFDFDGVVHKSVYFAKNGQGHPFACGHDRDPQYLLPFSKMNQFILNKKEKGANLYIISANSLDRIKRTVKNDHFKSDAIANKFQKAYFATTPLFNEIIFHKSHKYQTLKEKKVTHFYDDSPSTFDKIFDSREKDHDQETYKLPKMFQIFPVEQDSKDFANGGLMIEITKPEDIKRGVIRNNGCQDVLEISSGYSWSCCKNAPSKNESIKLKENTN